MQVRTLPTRWELRPFLTTIWAFESMAGLPEGEGYLPSTSGGAISLDGGPDLDRVLSRVWG